MHIQDIEKNSGNKTISVLYRWLSSKYFHLFCFVFLTLTIKGYCFGASDQNFEIPILKKLIDPSLYPNDVISETLKFHLTYFYRILSIFVTPANLQVTYFVLHVLSIAAILLAVYKITDYLFNNPFTSYLASMLIVLIHSDFLQATFGHDTVAYSIILFAIYFFLKSRYAIAFSLIGVAANIHALYAFYSLLMFSSYFVLYHREIPKLEILKSFFLLFLFSFPVLYWESTIIFQHLNPTDDWINLYRIRAPVLFPFSQEGSFYNYMGRVFAYVSYILMAALFFKNLSIQQKHKKIKIFVMTILVMCVTGTIFATLIPVKIIANLDFFRSLVFFVLFASIYAGNYFIAQGKKRMLLSFATIAAFLKNGLLIPFLGLNIALDLKKNKKISFPLLLCSSLFLLIIITGTILPRLRINHAFLSFADLQKRGFFLLFGIALGVICIIFFRKFFNRLKINPAIISLFILIFCIVKLCQGGIIPAYGAPEQKFLESWKDVQYWAKQNTPIDTIFLTPPYIPGFRVHSERSIVGDWKEGAVVFFNTELGKRWWNVMKDIGYGKKYKNGNLYISEGYTSFTKSKLIEVAKKYNASYFIIEKGRNQNISPENTIYKNNDFLVYHVGQITESPNDV